jgi:hypothetical protein
LSLVEIEAHLSAPSRSGLRSRPLWPPAWHQDDKQIIVSGHDDSDRRAVVGDVENDAVGVERLDQFGEAANRQRNMTISRRGDVEHVGCGAGLDDERQRQLALGPFEANMARLPVALGKHVKTRQGAEQSLAPDLNRTAAGWNNARVIRIRIVDQFARKNPISAARLDDLVVNSDWTVELGDLSNRPPWNDVETPGIAVMDGRLAKLLGALPSGADVIVELIDDVAIVKSGRSRYRLAALPAQDYPAPLSVNLDEAAELILDAETRAKLFTLPAPAISTEETRYYLNGIFLRIKAETTLTAVATDGTSMIVSIASLAEGATPGAPLADGGVSGGATHFKTLVKVMTEDGDAIAGAAKLTQEGGRGAHERPEPDYKERKRRAALAPKPSSGKRFPKSHRFKSKIGWTIQPIPPTELFVRPKKHGRACSRRPWRSR